MYEKGGNLMNKELKSAQTPGKRCRLYRKRANMTQAELAEAIGCSVDLISAVERGSRTLTVENAAAMSTIFGVRKECLLCFDDCETEKEKVIMPFAESVVTHQMEKEAFSIYAGLLGCNIVVIDESKHKNMSLDDFLHANEKEQEAILLDIFDEMDLIYYSFQDKDGVEITRCSANEYNLIVKEISDFAEFKIRKLCDKATAGYERKVEE